MQKKERRRAAECSRALGRLGAQRPVGPTGPHRRFKEEVPLELPPRRDGRRGRCGARRTAVTDVSEAAGGRPRLLPLLPGVLLHQ